MATHRSRVTYPPAIAVASGATVLTFALAANLIWHHALPYVIAGSAVMLAGYAAAILDHLHHNQRSDP